MKYPYFILIALLSGACSAGQHKLESISLEHLSDINLKQSYPLDSVFSTTKVIPLETTDSCLIGNWSSIRASRDFFFVLSEGTRVLKFDRTGRFIKTIGRLGQGPEEHLYIEAIDVSQDREEVYLLDARGLSVYDFDGNYLRLLALPKDDAYCNLMYYQNKIYFLSLSNSVTPQLMVYNLATQDTLNLRRRERDLDSNSKELPVGWSFSFMWNEKPCIYHYGNDTVFHIAADELQPEFLLQMGERKLKYPMSYDDPSSWKNCIQIAHFEAVNGYVFIFYTVLQYNTDDGSRGFMAMYSPERNLFYQHVNLENNTALALRDGTEFSRGFGRTMLRLADPEHLLKDNAFAAQYKLSAEDNPVIIEYDY